MSPVKKTPGYLDDVPVLIYYRGWKTLALYFLSPRPVESIIVLSCTLVEAIIVGEEHHIYQSQFLSRSV